MTNDSIRCKKSKKFYPLEFLLGYPARGIRGVFVDIE